MKLILISFAVCFVTVNAWWDEDETAIISNSILNNFKQHFNTILENKPANPPDFDVYEAMIASKAAEANKAIDNTVGASAQQKQRAKNEINQHKELIEDRFDFWEDSREKAIVMKGPFAGIVRDFIKKTKNEKKEKNVDKKYKYWLGKLRNKAPRVYATDANKEAWRLAEDVLEDEYDRVKERFNF